MSAEKVFDSNSSLEVTSRVFEEFRRRSGRRTGYPEKLRNQAISLVDAGFSNRVVGINLNLTPKTVATWVLARDHKSLKSPPPRRLIVVEEERNIPLPEKDEPKGKLRFVLSEKMSLEVSPEDLNLKILQLLREAWL